MNSDILNQAVNLIDDDLITDACNITGDQNSVRRKLFFSFAAALAVIFSGVLVIYAQLNQSPVLNVDLTESTSELGFGGVSYIETVSDSDITYKGTPFSKDEIDSFINDHKYIIVGAVAAEYDKFGEEFRISTKGYYIVSLGQTNTLDFNLINLPISIGDEIVGDVNILKKDGDIVYTIGVRGEGYSRFNKALKENKGSELAAFYFDYFTETLISETNEIYIIKGRETVSSDESVDYYNKFRTEYNVFSYEILTDKNNYISVVALHDEDIPADVTEEDSRSIISENISVLEKTTQAIKNITVDDVLSKNIKSIEWASGYDFLMGNAYKACNDKQKEDIISLVSGIDFVENNNREEKFGGAWYLKLIYDDGSSVILVIYGEEFLITNSEWQSVYYIDSTSNTVDIIYYLVGLE